MSETHRVSMLAYENCQILDVTGPLEVFARTSRWLSDHGHTHGDVAYEVEIIADRAGPVLCSNGLEIVAADRLGFDDFRHCYAETEALATYVDALDTPATARPSGKSS